MEDGGHRSSSRVAAALCTSISREGEKVVCLCLWGWCNLCDGSTWYWQVPLCEALLWGTSKFIHDFSDQWAVVNPNVISL